MSPARSARVFDQLTGAAIGLLVSLVLMAFTVYSRLTAVETKVAGIETTLNAIVTIQPRMPNASGAPHTAALRLASLFHHNDR